MKTVSISGFGGSYEWGCQIMLELGIEWLKKNPDFDFSVYKSPRRVYGLVITEDQRAKELDKVLTSGHPKLKEFGVTGAMHQAVLGHLAYIHRHGRDAWIAELGKHREPQDFFEFDGTEASCPMPDLSTYGPGIEDVVCECGHGFIDHAISGEDARDVIAKAMRGELIARPCHACDCSDLRPTEEKPQ
jgi:hypothetical protein